MSNALTFKTHLAVKSCLSIHLFPKLKMTVTLACARKGGHFIFKNTCDFPLPGKYWSRVVV